MERDETALERHNRMLLEDSERARYQEAADQGYGAIGALTDGWGAIILAFKARPILSLMVCTALMVVLSIVFTGSIFLPLELIAVAVVWMAISAFRKRRGPG